MSALNILVYRCVELSNIFKVLGLFVTQYNKRTLGNGGAPPSPERAAGSISFNAVNYMPSILVSNAVELNDVL